MAMTFNELKELMTASNIEVNNFNVSGEIATKLLNDFQKVDDKDLMEALIMANAVKAAQQMESDAAAKAEEEAAKAEAEKKAAEQAEAIRVRDEFIGKCCKNDFGTVICFCEGIAEYAPEAIKNVATEVERIFIEDLCSNTAVFRFSKILLENASEPKLIDFLENVESIMGKTKKSARYEWVIEVIEEFIDNSNK